MNKILNLKQFRDKDGKQLLKMATTPKFRVNDRLRALGEFNPSTDTITVNKRAHKNRKDLGVTINHEMMHRRSPSLSEKEVEKHSKTEFHAMSSREKKRLYKNFA